MVSRECPSLLKVQDRASARVTDNLLRLEDSPVGSDGIFVGGDAGSERAQINGLGRVTAS